MISVLKSIGWLAIIYCILGPLLCIVEGKLLNLNAASQVIPVIVIAACFFAYSLLIVTLFSKLYAARRKNITGYYLLNNVARICLCVVLLVVYAVTIRQELILFTVNLFIFYLTTAVYISRYCIREETKIKNKAK